MSDNFQTNITMISKTSIFDFSAEPIRFFLMYLKVKKNKVGTSTPDGKFNFIDVLLKFEAFIFGNKF